jgi:hypothetical protein
VVRELLLAVQQQAQSHRTLLLRKTLCNMCSRVMHWQQRSHKRRWQQQRQRQQQQEKDQQEHMMQWGQ